MKIVALVLILGALVGGGLILSETIPGYFADRESLAQAHERAATARAKLDALGKNASADQIDGTLRSAESAVSDIRFAEDGVAGRRNESLMFGGGTLAVLALGSFLLVRARRKQAPRPLVPAIG